MEPKRQRFCRTYFGIPLLLNVSNRKETVLQKDFEAIDDHLVRFRDHQDRNLCVLVSSIQSHSFASIRSWIVRKSCQIHTTRGGNAISQSVTEIAAITNLVRPKGPISPSNHD